MGSRRDYKCDDVLTVLYFTKQPFYQNKRIRQPDYQTLVILLDSNNEFIFSKFNAIPKYLNHNQ